MVRVDDRNASADARRPDDSMQIINDLFENPQEPGYELASRRRQESDADGRSFPFGLLVGLGLLGLLLTTAALQVPEDANLASAERDTLISRISEESEHTAQLEQEIAELQEDILTIENRVLESMVFGDELTGTMLQAQGSLGLGRVAGPGVVVELRDAERGADGELSTVERVLDKDLAMVVNGLWSSGAEAISINGERITPLSAIRRVEDVILVNRRPVAPPYEVRAIGDPRTLGPEFSAGSGGAWLRTANAQGGIHSDITTIESLTLPSGNASLDYAQLKETS